MSSEQPSTEEIKTSEEALEASAPADQDQPAPNEAADAAGVNEAASSAPQEEPQAEAVSEQAAAIETESEQSPQAAETSEKQEPAKTERKIQLKPKVDPEQFKAVPTLGSSAPAQPKASEEEKAAPSEEVSQEVLQEAAMLQIAQAAVPVDIPPEVDDLGESLEAELAAALSAQGGQELPKTLSDEEAAAAAPVATTSAGQTEEGLAEGDRLKGIVESINNDDVFIDLGSKALGTPGIVPLRQFGDKPPEVGQEVDVKVTSVKEAEGLIQLSLPRGHHKPAGDWDAVSAGQIVECVVNKSNKGGL
ncbi:MAG: S1 RNA-binding domain-containing protein, partial [Planctomycetaceae bacterium]|nr:S1 RNA-binding domain-containing protein [Planctomycetaceae bacterium]